MNGRVYDYNLGRFLSVDPFIQDPGNSQSINPYSYVMNNPLAGTDPTGYQWDGEAGHAFGQMLAVALGWKSPESARTIADAESYVGNHTLQGSADIGATIKAALEVGSISAAIAVTGKLAKDGIGGKRRGKYSNGAKSNIKGEGSDIGSENNKATISPQQRGRDSEDRVLKDMGLEKNKRKVSSSEGNSIHDAETSTHFIDIKDTKSVSDTKQMRIQRDAAKAEGKEHMVVTGKNTKVSKNMQRKSTITRRSDLGPKNSSKGVTGMVRVSGKIESNRLKKLDK